MEASPQGPGTRRGTACRLSIVVPCYDEEDVVGETIRRLRLLLDELRDSGRAASDSEILLVDDGSRDRTWAIIREEHARDPRVHGVRLSANRGHQVALLAGLFGARGDVVVSIDADLQDDVRAIGEMLAAYETGKDVVYGVRRSRDADHWAKRGTARG